MVPGWGVGELLHVASHACPWSSLHNLWSEAESVSLPHFVFLYKISALLEEGLFFGSACTAPSTARFLVGTQSSQVPAQQLSFLLPWHTPNVSGALSFPHPHSHDAADAHGLLCLVDPGFPRQLFYHGWVAKSPCFNHHT